VSGSDEYRDALWRAMRGLVYSDDNPGGWAAVPAYLRRHAARHAAAAEDLDRLLTDPEFLVHADGALLAAELPTVDDVPLSPRAEEGRALFHSSYASHRRADPGSRRQILMTDAARLGHEDVCRMLSKSSRWAVRWATGTGHSPGIRQVLMPSRLPEGSSATDLPVTAVALAAVDGRPQAVAAHGSPTRPGPVVVWDLRTGTALGQLQDPDCEATATAVVTHPSGDRTLAAVGYSDGSIAVWDLISRALLHRIPGAAPGDSRSGVLALTVAEADGVPILVSAHAGGGLRRWTLSDGTHRGEFAPPGARRRDPVRALAALASAREQVLSDIGRADVDPREVVVGGGDDGVLYVWNVRTGHLMARTRRGPAPIRAVTVAGVWNGAPLVVTGYEDGHVGGWDPLTGQESIPLTRLSRSGVTALVRQNQALALACGQDGVVRLWDLVANRHHRVLAQHSEGLTSVVIADIDGHDYAVSGGADGSVRVWDFDAQPPTNRLSRPRSAPSPVSALAIDRSGVGSRVVSAGRDGSVVDRDLANGDENRVDRLQKAVNGPRRVAVALGHGGRPIMVSAEAEQIVVLGPTEGPGQALRLPSGIVAADVDAVAVRAAPARSLVAVAAGGEDGRGCIEVYSVGDTSNEHRTSVSVPGGARVVGLAFAVGSGSPELVAIDASGVAHVWNLELPDYPAPVSSLDIGIPGAIAVGAARVAGSLHIAVGTPGRTVELWNLSGRERRNTLACAEPVEAVALDTDGGVVFGQGIDMLAMRSRDDELV
jgi:WD40 repeat protein